MSNYLNQNKIIQKNIIQNATQNVTQKSSNVAPLTLCILMLWITIFGLNLNLFSQVDNNTDEDKYYFDAIVFNSKNDTYGRVDIYGVIPYKSLKFLNNKEKYVAKYNFEINIYNDRSEVIETKNLTKTIVESDYFITQGGKGNFSYVSSSIELKAGNYKVSVRLVDEFSNQILERSKSISIVDFSSFYFSLSGIMLLNEIEEVNSKFKITPHVSDNVATLQNGFFLFFETYYQSHLDQSHLDKSQSDQSSKDKSKQIQKSVDYFVKIYNEKNELVKEFPKFNKIIEVNSNNQNTANISTISKQYFTRIEDLKGLSEGVYVVKIFAANATINTDFEESNLLAITQRTFKIKTAKQNKVLDNLDLAIRQLRYVARQTEIDKIQAGKDDREKLQLFNDFWAGLDPSKDTERNEAFEEYYARIQYVNENFKAYVEGWLTDKGQIYIVLGKPNNIERSQDGGRRVVYERWTYGSREFIFADNNGFGDFRLVRPFNFNEKFEYKP